MRIRWNDEAVQEMLTRTETAQETLREVSRRAAEARDLLEKSNRDGDNRALQKMQARLDAWTDRLRKMREETDDFRAGLTKARQIMDQAEKNAIRLAEAIPGSHGEPAGENWMAGGSMTGRGPRWNATLGPTPRTGLGPYPDWLKRSADRFDRNSF